ncbi:cellulose biosynthesis regulator YedQ [Cupriavidus metallidurans]|uniref:cellulose biosynthesis regulator YedQ n=1 Tax=Cupriavidus TaxID=106589 RepID=UPI000E92ADAA|nr:MULTISPECIES: cellulose biosynthesis regulator YedQ [unclassified Cupriavidus]GMG91783.1 diguanylate cyclase [Cupriavidus sp. TKC]HBO80885.1 cellulose biosynthesis regulator YedQ [Cupriavidus sp.]
MAWHKLLPRPRWLPRAALIYPQRVVVVGFGLAMLLMLVVAMRDLYLLRERVLILHQHDLALRALGAEAVINAERFKLSFVRDYAQQLLELQQGTKASTDGDVERAYAARNEPVWELQVPLGDAPIVGVSPQTLKGLQGFERRDEDLRADLQAARQLSHVLGVSQRSDRPDGTVTFISSNGFYVTYPALPPDRAPALIKRFSGIDYYRSLLPDRDPSHEMRWAQVYTQFESTQLRTTLSVPVYVAKRFRGVVAVDLEIRRLRDLIGLPEILGSHRYLLDRNGNVIVSSQTGGKTNLRWPDDFAGDLRNTAVSDLISQGTGMRHVNGQYVYFQRVGSAGNWLMVDTLDEYDVYATVARRLSLPLLTIWFLLPVLMYVTLRVVTLLFDHYLAAGRKLQQMAETDPLTQLANRRRFSEQFKKETARRQRDGTPLAMLMLDIDFFKRVNDKWGHASGDCVLVTMADLLRKQLREVDFPARLGGEEFAVLLPGASTAEAVAAAERLRLAVEAASVEAAPDAPHPEAGDGRIRFTVSIGVAEAGTDGCQTLDAMLAVADRRLYVAKEAGRNRVCATDAPDAPAGSAAVPSMQRQGSS